MWSHPRSTPTPTPAPCLHLWRRTGRLPRCAAASPSIVHLSLTLVHPLSLCPSLSVCVCLFFLLCSVTRSRSSLSLVYVLPAFWFCPPLPPLFFCMQAEWAGCWHLLCVWASIAPQRASESLELRRNTAAHSQPVAVLTACEVSVHACGFTCCLGCMSGTWWPAGCFFFFKLNMVALPV